MTRRSLPLLALLLLAVPLAAGLALHGCNGDHNAGITFAVGLQVTTNADAVLLPKGPDAIGGRGTGTSGDLGDFLLANDRIRAVIDQPGTDPTSYGGGFPLSNVICPSGGTLVDLASRAVDNDQFNQMLQGVVGYVTVDAGATGTAYATNPTGPVFLDPTQNFTATVRSGDTLTIASGTNAGRQFRVGLVVNDSTLGLFLPPGAVYDDDDFPPLGALQYVITRTTSPLENIVLYDTAEFVDPAGNPVTPPVSMEPVRLRVTGGIVSVGAVLPDGTTRAPVTNRMLCDGAPVTVETDYVLFRDASYLIIESRVVNPSNSVTPALFAVADLIITGGTGEHNLVPWTPFTGFTSLGVSSPVIVPFSAYRGRDLPEVSYAHVDSLAGQVIHASSEPFVAVNIQLAGGGTLAANATLEWVRRLAVGGHNDVASSADTAISLLASSPIRVNPADGSSIPNGYKGLAEIHGTVIGAPHGTVITAIQVDPALVFDPGLPSGLSSAAGFYPTTLYGAPELLVTQARPDPATGGFSMLVPSGFAGVQGVPTPTLVAPAGLTKGTQQTTYRLLVEAPGHDPQSVLVRLPAQQANNLVFDLRGETATIDLIVRDASTNRGLPARVLVLGMDPDGVGPTVATPDPVFGAPNATYPPDELAAGTGNVVHLVDGGGTIEVAPGAYQLIISRGPEYTIARWPPVGSVKDHVLLAAGQIETVSVTLDRTLDADLVDYVTADFHIHAGGSFDSAVPLRDRVASYLANGVEVMVGTEHDNLVDFAPVIAALDRETPLDLSAMITSQIGVETTGFVQVNVPTVLEFPNTAGHYNGWPLRLDPTLRRNGAPADEYRTPADIYDQLRALITPPPTTTTSVLQINHPRYPVAPPPLPALGLGFFTNGKAGYPQTATGGASITPGANRGYGTPLNSTLDASVNDLVVTRTLNGTSYADFDLLEVYGGVATLYNLQRMDWFTLISSGLVRTGTANSDSHSLHGSPGFPMNFVFTGANDSLDLGAVDLEAFNASLRPRMVQAATAVNANCSPSGGAMHVLGSSGPIVLVEVDPVVGGGFSPAGGPGDLVLDSDNDDQVEIRVTVLAAPWVPVDTLTVVVNGGSAASPLTGFGGAVNPSITPSFLTATPYPLDGSGNEDWFSTDPADFVRLQEVYTVSLPWGTPPGTSAGDHWIVVEARGTATAGDPYNLLVPFDSTFDAASVAIGFSNPVFIDRGTGGTQGTWEPNRVP